MQTNIGESLFVLWYYDNMFRWTNKAKFYEDKDLNIEFPFKASEEWYKDIEYKTMLFYSIITLREILMHACYNIYDIYAIKSFRKYEWYRQLQNTYNVFENSLSWKEDLSTMEKLQKWMMWKYAHEQFELQEFDNDPFLYITLYYDLFARIDDDIFIERVWLTIQDIIVIWTIFYINFQSRFKVNTEELNYPFIDNNKLSKFIELFSIDLEDIKARNIDKIDCLDHTKFKNYWKWDILKYPILKFDSGFISPVSRLILFRISNFIYFDIIEWNIYWDELWKANQELVADLLSKLKINETKIVDLDIEETWSNKKIDYIVSDWNIWLFIECKTNSLSLKSKEEGLTSIDKERISENLFQLYKYICLYKIQHKTYASLTYSDELKIIPILSYIYNPYIGLWWYESDVISVLKSKLCTDSELANIINNEQILEIIDNNPFYIIDNKTYIWVIDLIRKIWLNSFYDEIKLNEYSETNPNWLRDLSMIIKNIYEKYNFGNDIIDFYDRTQILDLIKSS